MLNVKRWKSKISITEPNFPQKGATNDKKFWTLVFSDFGETATPIAQRVIGRSMHWLVVNIPAATKEAAVLSALSGQTIFQYYPPGTPRPVVNPPLVYVFLLYEQRRRVFIDDMPTSPPIANCSFGARPNFDLAAFQSKYDLIGPLFGNFVKLTRMDEGDMTYPQLTQTCV